MVEGETPTEGMPALQPGVVGKDDKHGAFESAVPTRLMPGLQPGAPHIAPRDSGAPEEVPEVRDGIFDLLSAEDSDDEPELELVEDRSLPSGLGDILGTNSPRVFIDKAKASPPYWEVVQVRPTECEDTRIGGREYAVMRPILGRQTDVPLSFAGTLHMCERDDKSGRSITLERKHQYELIVKIVDVLCNSLTDGTFSSDRPLHNLATEHPTLTTPLHIDGDDCPVYFVSSNIVKIRRGKSADEYTEQQSIGIGCLKGYLVLVRMVGSLEEGRFEYIRLPMDADGMTWFQRLLKKGCLYN